MPIFMDRHHLHGMTPEHVAEAHRKDLEIQDRYGVKYLTYWYDSERCTGFCLVDAPDAATAEQVHREAHGQIPSEIMGVDLAAVEAFLGRISDPRHTADSTAHDTDAGLRAILVTDIVGSTELTTRLGDVAALELVRVHDCLVRRGLATHAGREVKHTGDGIMAVFDEVANAVRAAADIQRRFSAYNAEATEDLRIRIEAEADGILVSGSVRELCGQDAARFVALGTRRLKGFAERMPVFRFEWRNEVPPSNSNTARILNPPLRRAS